MLTVENLTKRFDGRTVLEDLDLIAAPGEIVALVGEAASGKTTTLELCCGQRAADRGRVTVAGFDVNRDAANACRHLAYLPSCPEFSVSRTGFTQVRESCMFFGRRIPESALRAALVLGGISVEWHDRKIGHYSTALRRQLALVVAILMRPDVLLLDDPTRDLEPSETDKFVATLRRLRKRGATILLATRDLAFARRLATRIAVLERGSLVEVFDPNAPRHATQANAYLADLLT